jgi:hypothetical protein
MAALKGFRACTETVAALRRGQELLTLLDLPSPKKKKNHTPARRVDWKQKLWQDREKKRLDRCS